jgi:group I intron endonuclease
MQYIYKIVNLIDGKFYVGRTNDLKERWNRHIEMLRNNRHHCIYLQRAWNKYGDENFEFAIEEVFDTGDDEIDLKLSQQAEQELINTYKPGYGIYNTSWSSVTGVLKGEEHFHYRKTPKEWMSEEGYARAMEKWKSQKGEKNPFYGRKHSKETLQILRQKCALWGEKNGMYGKKHTDEYKKIKSEMMKGRYDGEKNPFYGRKHTEETKRRISEKKKGQMKGVPKSEEQKRKMSENSSRRIPIEIDGVKYRSFTHAQNVLGIDRKTITYRVRSDNFPTYKFSE